MTPAGIEPATFRFIAQHLNHCTTAVPKQDSVDLFILEHVNSLSLDDKDCCRRLSGQTDVYNRLLL